jgi:3-dehydroquinate synthase
VFLNDVSGEEMNAALRRHKEIMKQYPRNGEGIDAYVDASDTGYTENAKTEEEHLVEKAAGEARIVDGVNGNALNGKTNGNDVNGYGFNGNGTNGHSTSKESSGVSLITEKIKNMTKAGAVKA